MPLRWRSAVAALLVAASPMLTGCTSEAGSGSSGEGYIAGKGVITVLPETERKRPEGTLAGETLDGESVSLEQYDGQVVVINVWGSWCPPCRAEAPDIVAAANELDAKDVQFLGINSRDLDPAQARAFVRQFSVPYPSIYDPSGQALLALHGTLPANSIPSTVVIDREGRVAGRVLGTASRSTLVGLVEDIDGEAGSDSGSTT